MYIQDVCGSNLVQETKVPSGFLLVLLSTLTRKSAVPLDMIHSYLLTNYPLSERCIFLNIEGDVK
jgi:hypothetical protein